LRNVPLNHIFSKLVLCAAFTGSLAAAQIVSTNPVSGQTSITANRSPITVGAPKLSITTTQLSPGQTGTGYQASLEASGGVQPYKWAITSGALPSGMSLSAASGVISGTLQGYGTFRFIVTVTDSERSPQSKAAALAIAVTTPEASPLSIQTPSLPAGQNGVAYASSLQASGGTPGYSWTMASGALPAGLSLGGTTGQISGTPTAVGTSQFTVAVRDNGSPAQSQTAQASITISAAQASNGPGATWYIRRDGGTRYSANARNGQCDGTGDAPYSGRGVNQHCAFNDYRYLWDDRASYGVSQWVISGGDTVILRDGPWRVGFDQGRSSNDVWCYGGNGPFSCTNPTIPAGTPSQHTRILGENYASCSNGNVSDRSKMTQIFGGYGVYTPLNITGTQNLDVQCLEITRHSQCVTSGNPMLPSGCSRSGEIDDFDSDGIEEDNRTANVNLTDLWIHGHPGRGVKGPIGGVVTATRVNISYNGQAGWDFDDGNSTPFGAGAVWNFNYSTIEWSGCNQEYPIAHTYPAASCYGQSNEGYGDGVGTAPGQGLDVSIDHSIFRYNVQDGEDFGHVDVGSHSFSITNSQSYANGGGQFKWGWGFTTINFANNLVLANCHRMSAPINGAPENYNAHLGDFCRANDALSFNFQNGTQALFANNTIVTYASTTFDMKCVPITSKGQSNCSTAVFTLKNNIVRGYRNPTYDYGGNTGPGGFCGARCNDSTQNIGTINRDHNLFYGLRGTCIANTQTPGSDSGTSTNESCSDPLLVNEPAVYTGESQLDGFDFDLTSGSPARQGGTPIQGLEKDIDNVQRPAPPSLGAIEYGSPRNTAE